MYGLLKENGPFLVDAEEKPFTNVHLVQNKHSWHKVANMLYVDNPVGTGFSHTDDKYIQYKDLSQAQVTEELILFLEQFWKILPHYLNSSKFNQKLFIFGESYGGTYVVDLAASIAARGLTQVPFFNSVIFSIFNLVFLDFQFGWSWYRQRVDQSQSPMQTCRLTLHIRINQLPSLPKTSDTREQNVDLFRGRTV